MITIIIIIIIIIINFSKSFSHDNSGHIGVPKQGDSGHVDAPKNIFGV